MLYCAVVIIVDFHLFPLTLTSSGYANSYFGNHAGTIYYAVIWICASGNLCAPLFIVVSSRPDFGPLPQDAATLAS